MPIIDDSKAFLVPYEVLDREFINQNVIHSDEGILIYLNSRSAIFRILEIDLENFSPTKVINIGTSVTSIRISSEAGCISHLYQSSDNNNNEGYYWYSGRIINLDENPPLEFVIGDSVPHDNTQSS